VKVAGFEENGGPEKIAIFDVPEPTMGATSVLVRVEAASLNHFDLLVLAEPPSDNAPRPFWGGADVAGVVVDVGRNVSAFVPGDSVVINPSLFCNRCEHCVAGEESLCDDYGILGDSRTGGFAELVAVEERNVIHLPPGISFAVAAAAPLVFQTAWRALVTRARLRPGDDVLILGASGGVGTAAIAIAKLLGARVFAMTTTEKVQSVRELGADVVVDRRQPDAWDKLRRQTEGRGVDVVVESVGAPTWGDSLKSLVKGGRLVTYGRTAGRIAETDVWLVFWHQLEILGSTMASRSEFERVMRLVFRGQLTPVVDRVYALEDARSAYERLGRAEQIGKIVLRVGAEGRLAR
jgi:NADPH:quinone reductase-like Zn-dependent oxidoreductase